MSNTLIKILGLFYIVICMVCIMEQDYPKALYWLSAIGLLISILWGFK